MKKQTPIQELKEHIHDRLITAESHGEPNYALMSLMIIANQLVEEEKKLLEGVYLKGLNKGVAFERHQQTESYPCEWPSDISFEDLIDIERD